MQFIFLQTIVYSSFHQYSIKVPPWHSTQQPIRKSFSKLLKTQGSTIVRLKRCLSALNLKKIKEGTKVWQLVLAMKREISYFKYSENSKNESIHAHKHMWCSSSCKRHKEAQLWCQKLVNALNLQKIKESMIIRQLVWVMKTNPSLKPLKELKK